MADFIVIGAGIAGASVAAELAQVASVTVLEAEPTPGYHASGRSAAMFLENYGNATVRALNSASAGIHHESGVLRRRAFLLVSGEGQDAEFDAECADFGAGEVSLAEAQALWPILNTGTARRAGHYTEAFDLDTDKCLQGYLRRTRGAGGETGPEAGTGAGTGAELVTGARITAITRKGSQWQVTDGTRHWSAPRIINAAGAWADGVAAMAGVAPIGIQPYRRSMARLAAPGGHDTAPWPFVDGIGESWYAKPDAGALLVSPSEEHPMEPADVWADDLVLAEGLDRYSRFVTAAPTRPLATWAGLRSFAPDRALVLGPDRAEPGFIWCAGQGGYGFQTAPAAARLTADLALGRKPDLPADVVAALSPDRF